MFSFIRFASTLFTLVSLLSTLPTEAGARAGGRSYLLRAASNYGAYYDRRRRLATTGPSVAVDETPVPKSLTAAAALPPVAAPPVATVAVHVETLEEWQAECRGQLVGTGWGFCVVTAGKLASSAP